MVGEGGTILQTTNGGVVSIGMTLPSNTTLNLSPNPAMDKITISIPIAFEAGKLTLVNIQGQQLITRPITEKKTQIDISSLPGGVYFVRLTNDRTVETGKFIKK